MAGTVQIQKRSEQAQTGEERLRQFSASLKRKKEREVWDAVREFGVRDVIDAYRKENLEPPADLLLNLLYTEPDTLTQEESELLQKAYGWEYIKTVYESQGRGEQFRAISTWGKIKGWFGRKFGSYKKVNKFENHSFESFGAMERRKEELKQEEEKLKAAGQAMVSELEQVKAGEEQSAARIEAGEEAGAQAPASTALETLGNLLKRGFGNGERREGEETEKTSEETGETEETGEPGQISAPPRFKAGFLIREDSSLALPDREEDEAGEAALFQDIGENDMVYREYIILESPEETQFEDGIREYRSETISLNILDKIKYPLRNTDFTLVEEEATGGCFAVMRRGDASLTLGSVTFSIEGMKYTDMDSSFHAERAGIEINKTEGLALKGGASVSRLQIRKTGLDFMAFDAELERFDWLGEAFTLDNPKFHMEKAGEGWLKSVSMSGLHSAAEGFRLDLTSGAGEQTGAGEPTGAAGNTNGWKLLEKETTAEGEPAGKTRWVPEINNGSGTVTIADFLTLSVSGIKADENQLTAGSVSVGVTSTDGVFSASFSAENMAYQFGTGDFTVGGISGSIAVQTEAGSGSLKVENASYQDGAISIASASGELELWEHKVSVTASNLKYQKGTGFSFKQIKGKLSGNLGNEIFSLTEPTIFFERPEGAESLKVTASAGLELGTEETVKISAGNISVTLEDKVFKRGEAENPTIRIANGMAVATADKLTYEAGVFQIENASMDISPDSVFSANLSAKNMAYQSGTGEFTVGGISGSIAVQTAEGSGSLKVENASYQDGAISITSASGELELWERKVSITASNLKYQKGTGFSFEQIEGKLSGNLGNEILSLTDPTISLKRPEGAGSLKVTASAGLELGSEETVKISAENISVTLEDKVFKRGEAENPTIRIANGMAVATANKLTYEAGVFQIENASMDISPDNVFSANLSAENMAYQSGTGEFTVGGISGSIAVQTAEGSGSLKVENASYQDGAVSIASASGELELWERKVSVTASNLKYQKGTGFSFEQIEGKLSGNLGNEIFSLTEPTIFFERPEGAESLKVTASAGLELGSEETVKISAENISVTLEDRAFKRGEAKEAVIQIANGTAVATADMAYEEGIFKALNPSLNIHIKGQEENAAAVSAAEISYQADTKALSILEASGNLNLKFPSASMSLTIKGAGYEAGAVSVGTVNGNVTVEETTVGVTGEELAFSKDNGFDFKKIAGTYESDISVINGLLTLKHPSVTAKKEGNNIGFTIGAGLEAKSESGNFGANFGQISVSLMGGKLQEIHAGETNLHAWSAEFGAGSVNYVPKDRKITAEALTFKTGRIEALGSAGDFLENLSLSLERLSYSPDTGLSYEGFKIDPARLTLLSIGGLEAYVDFSEKKVGALADFQFPEGGTLTKPSDGKGEVFEAEAVNIRDTKGYGLPGETQDAEAKGGSGNGGLKADYTAPMLFKFGLSYPVVPGISLGASISMGAGAALFASLAAQKAGEEYAVSGTAGMAGNAWLQASLEVIAGSRLANITAALLAKLGIKIATGAEAKLTFSKEERNLKMKGGSLDYGFSAEAAFDLGVKLSAKFLWFKERTLYEKQLGKWKLGEIEFSGKTEWGNWSEENIKKSLKIGGNNPDKDKLQALAPEGVEGEKGPSLTGSGKEKLDELLDKKKEREEAEKFLLQTDQVFWGDGTGEAAAEIVRQIQSLSELYGKELLLREIEIKNLLVRRDESLRKGGMDEVMLSGRSAMAQIEEQSQTITGAIAKAKAKMTGMTGTDEGGLSEKANALKQFSVAQQRETYRKIYKNYYREYLKGFILWRIRLGINWIEKNKTESAEKAGWRQLTQDEKRQKYEKKWAEIDRMKQKDGQPSEFQDLVKQWKACQKLPDWENAMKDSGTEEFSELPENLAKRARALEFDSDVAKYLISEEGKQNLSKSIGLDGKKQMIWERIKTDLEGGKKVNTADLDGLLGGSLEGVQLYAAVMPEIMKQRWKDLGEKTSVSLEEWRKADETLKKAQKEQERIAGINDLVEKFLAKGTDKIDPDSFKAALDEIKGRIGGQGEENIRAKREEIKADCKKIQEDYVKMEAALSRK